MSFAPGQLRPGNNNPDDSSRRLLPCGHSRVGYVFRWAVSVPRTQSQATRPSADEAVLRPEHDDEWARSRAESWPHGRQAPSPGPGQGLTLSTSTSTCHQCTTQKEGGCRDLSWLLDAAQLVPSRACCCLEPATMPVSAFLTSYVPQNLSICRPARLAFLRHAPTSPFPVRPQFSPCRTLTSAPAWGVGQLGARYGVT